MAEELDELIKKAKEQKKPVPAEETQREEQVPPGFPGEDEEKKDDKEEKKQTDEQKKPYFSEDMSSGEILEGFMLGVKNSDEPVIMDLHEKNGERVQVEGIKEEQDRAELDHRMIDPNTVNDHMEGINVYVNGKQVTAEQFCQFIEEHKAEFVALCNDRFPNMAELALTQKKELSLEEKQHVLTTIGNATHGASVAQKPVTENDGKKAGDLDEQMKKAALAQGRRDLRYAQDHLDELPKYNAQFYVQEKNSVSMVEFSKYTTKDGQEKFITKLNGKYVSDKDMAKYLSEHPGQITRQVDRYISVQKNVAAKGNRDGKKQAQERGDR